MSADETHVDDMRRVVDHHNKPIVVAFYVEDHPVSSNDASVTVLLLYFRRRVPFFLLNFAIPGEQRRLCVRVLLPEFSKCFFLAMIRIVKYKLFPKQLKVEYS